MYQFISYGPYSCPAASSQYATVTGTAGAILSVGFQNIGYAELLRPTQMFVGSATFAFVQVLNTSLTGTDWYVWIVWDPSTSSLSSDKAPTAELHSAPNHAAEVDE